jgi:hypothetical protein
MLIALLIAMCKDGPIAADLHEKCGQKEPPFRYVSRFYHSASTNWTYQKIDLTLPEWITNFSTIPNMNMYFWILVPAGIDWHVDNSFSQEWLSSVRSLLLSFHPSKLSAADSRAIHERSNSALIFVMALSLRKSEVLCPPRKVGLSCQVYCCCFTINISDW